MQGVKVYRIAPTQKSGYCLNIKYPVDHAKAGMKIKFINNAIPVDLTFLKAFPISLISTGNITANITKKTPISVK